MTTPRTRADCPRCQRSRVGRCRWHQLRTTEAARSAAMTLTRAVLYVSMRTDEVSIGIDDICIEAWRLDRGRFGMRTEPAYPDTSRVIAEMCARSGPVAIGWLRRHNGKVQLTEDGAAAVAANRRRTAS